MAQDDEAADEAKDWRSSATTADVDERDESIERYFDHF
jgi:hypothetical protein